MTAHFPKSFETLEAFAADWALPTQNARQGKRIRSTTGELRAFYNAMLPLLPDIMVYIDRFPLGEIPAEAKPLYHMALSLAEVAPHVELYGGDPKVPYSFDEHRFVAEHGEIVN